MDETPPETSQQIIEHVTYKYIIQDLRVSYDSLWELLVEVENQYIPHYIVCKFDNDLGFDSLEEAFYECFMCKLDPLIIDDTIDKLRAVVDEYTFTTIKDMNDRSVIVAKHIQYGLYGGCIEDHEHTDVCEKIKCGTPDWKYVGPYIMGK